MLPQEIGRVIQRAREIAGIDGLMIWTDHDLPCIRAWWRPAGSAAWPLTSGSRCWPTCRERASLETTCICTTTAARDTARIGAWKGLGTGGEDFLFLCPNREEPLHGYTGRTDAAGPPRLRRCAAGPHPFPLGGKRLRNAVRLFLRCLRAGVLRPVRRPASEKREAAAAFLSRLAGYPLGARPPGGDTFERLWKAAGLAKLFDFKKHSIARMVRALCRRPRARWSEGRSGPVQLFPCRPW